MNSLKQGLIAKFQHLKSVINAGLKQKTSQLNQFDQTRLNSAVAWLTPCG